MERREKIIAGSGLFLVAAFYLFLICYRSGSQGLVHHDEGAYAVEAWRAVEGGMGRMGIDPYCNQPAYPFIVILLFRTIGVSDLAVRLPSMIMGFYLLALAFLWGWRYSSIRCGLMCALVLVTCPFHIIYARVGLTEAMFTSFILSALFCFWHAQFYDEKRIAWYIAGGVMSALAVLVKWNGFLALFSSGCFLGFCFLWDAVGRKIKKGEELKDLLKRIFREYRVLFIGICLAGIVMMILMIPWLYYLRMNYGLRNVLGKGRFTSRMTGLLSVIVHLPYYLKLYLGMMALWSKGILVLSVGALALFLKKGERKGLFFYFWVVCFGFFLVRWSSYPRLFHPIVISLAMPAGIFLDRAVGLTDRKIRLGVIAAVMVVGILLGWMDMRDELKGNNDGYRMAGQYIENRKDIPDRLLCRMQENFYFYMPHAARIGRNDKTRTLLESGHFYLLVDTSATWHEDTVSLMEHCRDKMELVKEFRNDKFGPLIFQPFQMRDFKYFLSGVPVPDHYLAIKLYRVTGECTVPEEWK